MSETPPKVTCPKCGSDQIHANRRTPSFLLMITCLACGNEFRPGSTVESEVQNKKDEKIGRMGCVIFFLVLIVGIAVYWQMGKDEELKIMPDKVEVSTTQTSNTVITNSPAVTESNRVYDSIIASRKSQTKRATKEPPSDYLTKLANGRAEFITSIKKQFAIKGFAVSLKTVGDKNLPNLIITHPFFTDVSFYQLQKWDDLKMGYGYFDKIFLTDGENYKSADLKGN